jgi:predicted nucleic acid-binding protein
VRYLLDVNALIALAHDTHALHARAVSWALLLPATEVLLTTPLTELGFCRVSVNVGLQPDVAAARFALRKLKSSPGHTFEFLPDALGADVMPAYVRRPAELTDGHLLELAKANNARLVTLDTKIPGATRVP